MIQRLHSTPRTLALVFCFLALFMSSSSAAYAQNDNRARRTSDANSSTAPTVTLVSEANVLTLCPEDQARAQNVVRLTADTTGFGSGARYSWTTSGGRIVADGRTATLDLTGVEPGAYTASLEVDEAGDIACRAFTSATVIARPCAPVRVQCPTITMSCPDTVQAGQPVTISANIGGRTADVIPTFEWTISGGTIIEGQGTSTITVDTTNSAGTFDAQVRVLGFDQTCPTTAACSIASQPVPLPRKFDEFPSVSFDDDKARLDNLAIELQNDPGARGFIVVHPGRRSRPNQGSRLGERARRYLTATRGVDASRLVVVGGAPRERDTFELYIVPAGATPPTVDQ